MARKTRDHILEPLDQSMIRIVLISIRELVLKRPAASVSPDKHFADSVCVEGAGATSRILLGPKEVRLLPVFWATGQVSPKT